MKRERREIRPGEKWPRAGVFFVTDRGSFEIAAAALKRAELTGDDFEIRRAFAVNLPPGARASRREKIPGGGLRISWRVVRVFGLFKRDRDAAKLRPVDLEALLRHSAHELGGRSSVALDAPGSFAHGEVDEPSESARDFDAAFAREPMHADFELGILGEGRVELAAELEPPADDFALR